MLNAPETGKRRCLILSQMRRDGFSGGQVHAAAVRAMLEREGWEAEILTPFSGRARTRPAVFALRYAVRPWSRQTAIWWLREGHNIYLRQALRRALAPGSSPALLYAQDPLSAQAALQLRRPGVDKVALVVHFNDSQALEWVIRGELRQESWAYKQIRQLERSVLPQVDSLVYVSEYMRARIEQQIPGAAAVHSAVIPNFADLPSSAPEARAADILSIGTLEPRKNQAYTLRVLGELRRRGHDFTATFLGGGQDQGTLEELARKLGIASAVYFAGNVPNAAGWLESHRVLAHAARLENCPIALIEALAAGIPVVAARVGGIPELIDERTGGFWDLDSIEDGADKLEALLTDEPRWVSAAQAAHSRWRRRFSPESAGRALAVLFAALLRGNASAPEAATEAPGAADRLIAPELLRKPQAQHLPLSTPLR